MPIHQEKPPWPAFATIPTAIREAEVAILLAQAGVRPCRPMDCDWLNGADPARPAESIDRVDGRPRVRYTMRVPRLASGWWRPGQSARLRGLSDGATPSATRSETASAK